MIDFKVNGEPKQIPTCWEDVTFGVYLKIGKVNDNLLELLQHFTGMSYEIIKKAKFVGVEDVIRAMSFIRKPPILPEYVTEIGPYKLPVNHKGGFDIQFESLAQFEDMRAVMMKTNDSTLQEDFAKYVAIYLQKIRDGEYDNQKALGMLSEVYQLPALKVLALGAFFLAKLDNLLNGITVNYQKSTPSQKKSKPATKASKKRSARSGRSSRPRSR